MELKEIGCEIVDRIYLVRYWDQCRACEHSNVTSSSVNGGEFLD
jgi:hypothetical protein